MHDHTKGLIITTLGVLFVVPDSLFVRLIETDPMTIAFWRGLTAGLIVLAFVLSTQRGNAFAPLRRTGWTGAIYVLLMGSTSPAFVLAVTQTSVANVVFILASMPMFAAIWSRILLNEPVSKRIAVTMGVVLCGLAVIAYGSGDSEKASWKGDVWAVYVSFAYAAALTAARRMKDISMVPAVSIAYLGAAILIALLYPLADAFVDHWRIFLGHGIFIGCATCLLTLGPRYITSSEVSLLILLESVLAPLLVWAVIGEHPGRFSLMGGFIVIAALLASNTWALRRTKAI
ncbi:MAG: DMT family transporter [Paracoccaceae bacterium]